MGILFWRKNKEERLNLEFEYNKILKELEEKEAKLHKIILNQDKLEEISNHRKRCGYGFVSYDELLNSIE